MHMGTVWILKKYMLLIYKDQIFIYICCVAECEVSAVC